MSTSEAIIAIEEQVTIPAGASIATEPSPSVTSQQQASTSAILDSRANSSSTNNNCNNNNKYKDINSQNNNSNNRNNRKRKNFSRNHQKNKKWNLNKNFKRNCNKEKSNQQNKNDLTGTEIHHNVIHMQQHHNNSKYNKNVNVGGNCSNINSSNISGGGCGGDRNICSGNISGRINNINNNNNKRQLFSVAKFFLPDKRPRKECIIPPTKFLLGGNISDPLNLNSLQNESENATTPKSSPIPTPPHYKAKIDVIIPPNINDPLHLLDPVDSVEYELQLCSPLKKKSKPRHRKKRKSARLQFENNPSGSKSDNINHSREDDSFKSEGELVVDTNEGDDERVAAEISVPDNEAVEAARLKLEREKAIRDLKLELGESGRKRRLSEGISLNKNKTRRIDAMDKIVSPVIPQPGAWKRPHWNVPRGPGRTRLLSSTSVSEDIVSPTDCKIIADVLGPATNEEMAMEASSKNEENLSGIAPDTIQPAEDRMCLPSTSTATEPESSITVFAEKPKSQKQYLGHQYGNYDRYYGYRNLNEFIDVRLKVFMRNARIFRDKDILDIGCNVGLMTIAIAKFLNPKTITGIDIDKNLIQKGRRNLSMYARIPLGSDTSYSASANDDNKLPEESNQPEAHCSKKDVRMKKAVEKKSRYQSKNSKNRPTQYFPISFPICFGNILNIDNKSPDDSLQNKFPQNVYFRTMNYVHKEESLLNSDTQQYDLIMCLSVTKWIHLNFGDNGLKMTFKRIFNQLRPGGKLILEAQNWASYKKKKKLTETIFKNYKEIEFFPNKFHEYLLSSEVGFSHSYVLGIPRHVSKGYRRPIQLYIKGDFTPSQAQWSDAYNPQTPYEHCRGIYADLNLPSTASSIWGKTTPYGNSGNYSYRHPTPSHGYYSSSASPYYNPKQTDNYLPSYDNETHRRSYLFASPLYSTTWSPPREIRGNQGGSSSKRRSSSSHTPHYYGSVRSDTQDDNYTQDIVRPHVYVGVFPSNTSVRTPSSSYSSRSIDEQALETSPRTKYIYTTTDNIVLDNVDELTSDNSTISLANDATDGSVSQIYDCGDSTNAE